MSDDAEDLNAHEQNKADARESFKDLPLDELVIKMRDLAETKVNVEAKLKQINAFYDVIRMECVPQRMEKDGIERISYEGIGRVSLTADVNVGVKGGCKEGLFKWLKDNKLADLIQPTVNSSTLKAWYKARLKKGESVPDKFLNAAPFVRASITKE